jgi:hypothetical protein
MTMAAHRVSPVDPFALARAELENVFKQLAEAGASHHVTLGKLVTEGMERVGALTFQGHLDTLFAEEQREVPRWARPEGSEVRERTRHLETDFGRVTVRRHGLRLAGETAARFPMDQHPQSSDGDLCPVAARGHCRGRRGGLVRPERRAHR